MIVMLRCYKYSYFYCSLVISSLAHGAAIAAFSDLFPLDEPSPQKLHEIELVKKTKPKEKHLSALHSNDIYPLPNEPKPREQKPTLVKEKEEPVEILLIQPVEMPKGETPERKKPETPPEKSVKNDELKEATTESLLAALKIPEQLNTPLEGRVNSVESTPINRKSAERRAGKNSAERIAEKGKPLASRPGAREPLKKSALAKKEAEDGTLSRRAIPIGGRDSPAQERGELKVISGGEGDAWKSEPPQATENYDPSSARDMLFTGRAQNIYPEAKEGYRQVIVPLYLFLDTKGYLMKYKFLGNPLPSIIEREIYEYLVLSQPFTELPRRIKVNLIINVKEELLPD